MEAGLRRCIEFFEPALNGGDEKLNIEHQYWYLHTVLSLLAEAQSAVEAGGS